MSIKEITEAARKLRLAKRPVRFRPRLIYLVESHGMYVHPRRTYLSGGQTSWTDSSLWFQCHLDAREFALAIPGSKIVKLNICAFEEPVIKARRAVRSQRALP